MYYSVRSQVKKRKLARAQTIIIEQRLSHKTRCSNEHLQCFEQEYEKYQNFFIWKSSFFGCKMFDIFE